MNAADHRRLLNSIIQNRSQFLIVDAGDHHRNQYNAKTRIPAVRYGQTFFCQQTSTPKTEIDVIGNAIKLEKNRGKPSVFRPLDIAFFMCRPQTVGIELNKGKTPAPPHFDDLRQIVSYRGLPAGKLDVAGGCRLFNPVEPESDDFKIRIGLGCVSGCCETIRAGKIAAPGDLQ